MAHRKTGEERLQEIDTKLKELESQKQSLLKREKEKHRKERTRHLIEIGALSEKYFNCEKIMPEEFGKLLQKIVTIDNVKTLISQLLYSNNK